ncbi:hypothetical protein NQZ68_027272 [Dissostichus eleginoides]|nr:hypothetical protein NQZ68_027272 [Dissostichus eleginoides]
MDSEGGPFETTSSRLLLHMALPCPSPSALSKSFCCPLPDEVLSTGHWGNESCLVYKPVVY